MNKKYLILGGIIIGVSAIGYLLYRKFVFSKGEEKVATEPIIISEPISMGVPQVDTMTQTTSSVRPDSVLNSADIVAYTPDGRPLTNTTLVLQRV